MRNKECLNTGETKASWVTKLQAMTDEQLQRHCEHFIWLSAYANNNPRSDYHWLCDAGYDECARRDRIGVYEAAHRQAVASAQ